MRILIVGNCQTKQMNALLSLNKEHNVRRLGFNELVATNCSLNYLKAFDLVIAQEANTDKFEAFWASFAAHPNTELMPGLIFPGLFPDFARAKLKGDVPLYSSKIINSAFHFRLSDAETAALFTPRFLELLGYEKNFPAHKQMFLRTLSAFVPDAEYFLEKWMELPDFFYSINHPHMHVTEDILRCVLKRKAIALPDVRLADYIPDPLKNESIFPTHNHPRSTNKLFENRHVYKLGSKIMSCSEYVRSRFEKLAQNREFLVPNETDNDNFQRALAEYRSNQPRTFAVNPYSERPSRNFWSRMVARPAMAEVKPSASLSPMIGPKTRVATAGSCFAQHIARTMARNGLNYYVAEPAPEGLASAEAETKGYGVFSARYGNIYSPRQLLQLIQRAYGGFTPRHSAWKAKGGGLIDPFRPNIGETFPSLEALEADREQHFAAVREMFEKLEVFVFTMGLTECWVDQLDGSAFPVAPGVVSPEVDASEIGFVNFDAATIRADMTAFFDLLKAVNPGCKVLLTVSPVPLIATYTNSDVLSATTYSKSALRAVAGELSDTFSFVQYFPSYEIITGSFTKGAYFDSDLRSVREEGVNHVMGVFMETLVYNGQNAVDKKAAQVEDCHLVESYQKQMNVICDEELIVQDL